MTRREKILITTLIAGGLIMACFKPVHDLALITIGVALGRLLARLINGR